MDDYIASTLAKEGGFVNRADDRGGPTKYGITQATLSEYLGRPVSIDDVRNMSIDTAKTIMKQEYYFDPQLDMLPASLQPQMLDMCVNHGQGNAIKILQRLINRLGYGNLVIDGEIGRVTAAAVVNCYAAMGSKLINALADARADFCRAIVANDQSQAGNLNGWLNRAESFKV